MKTFKVTVENQTYTVQVEELSENTSQESVNASTKTNSPAAQPNPAATSPTAAPAKEPSRAEEPKVETPKPDTEGGYTLKAPMPGSVLEVKVGEGDNVKDGDVLLVLEAMKMENELTASAAGTVAQIFVKKGDTVNSGDPLIMLS